MTNVLVLAEWWLRAHDASRTSGKTETEVFMDHCTIDLVASNSSDAVRDCESVHRISLLSQDAILATRYCSVYDKSLQAAGDGSTSACGTVSCVSITSSYSGCVYSHDVYEYMTERICNHMRRVCLRLLFHSAIVSAQLLQKYESHVHVIFLTLDRIRRVVVDLHACQQITGRWS